MSRSYKVPPTPLRKGKWTSEEENYAAKIISLFNQGRLPIPPGTTLRSYLSEKLNCDPMRITKKYSGVNCIGKVVYQPCDKHESHCFDDREIETLNVFESIFLIKLYGKNFVSLPRGDSKSSLSSLRSRSSSYDMSYDDDSQSSFSSETSSSTSSSSMSYRKFEDNLVHHNNGRRQMYDDMNDKSNDNLGLGNDFRRIQSAPDFSSLKRGNAQNSLSHPHERSVPRSTRSNMAPPGEGCAFVDFDDRSNKTTMYDQHYPIVRSQSMTDIRPVEHYFEDDQAAGDLLLSLRTVEMRDMTFEDDVEIDYPVGMDLDS